MTTNNAFLLLRHHMSTIGRAHFALRRPRWPLPAPFHRLFAKSFFLGIFRLFIDERMVPVGGAGEIGRCGFTAQIAVNALIIHVESPGNVLRKLACNLCHNNRLRSLPSQTPMVCEPLTFVASQPHAVMLRGPCTSRVRAHFRWIFSRNLARAVLSVTLRGFHQRPLRAAANGGRSARRAPNVPCAATSRSRQSNKRSS
jgi:hypothetical protein